MSFRNSPAFPRRSPRPAISMKWSRALSPFRRQTRRISKSASASRHLPLVNLDRDQFKRLVVNLVDNAAEAMRDSLVKGLYVATSAPRPRPRRADDCGHRLRRVARRQREALPALLLHQEPRHGPRVLRLSTTSSRSTALRSGSRTTPRRGAVHCRDSACRRLRGASSGSSTA